MKFLPESWLIYFRKSNTLLYSYLASLPLLAGYEILLLISRPAADHMVRISVDVWIQSLISLFGVNTMGFILLFVAFGGFYILYREREDFASLQLSYFPLIILESMTYALVTWLLLSMVTSNITMMAPDPSEQFNYLQNVSLSLGAGLYEELFYRVLLFGLLLYLFSKFLDKKWASSTIAIITAAGLFSLAHFTGTYGDVFTLQAFTFRFLFGVVLNILYLTRGFAVTAWTHALYDIFVITFI